MTKNLSKVSRAAQADQRAPKQGQLARTTSAVLDAMTELLAEVGYRQITVEMVVARSAVARSTIYRHWSSVADIAIAAFERSLGDGLPTPDHGDVRTDLVHLYRRFAKVLQGSLWGQMLPIMIEASEQDRGFAQMLARLDRERRSNARRIIKRGIERGELAPSTDIERIIDCLSGMIYYRFLISGKSLREKGLVEWAVDQFVETTG